MMKLTRSEMMRYSRVLATIPLQYTCPGEGLIISHPEKGRGTSVGSVRHGHVTISGDWLVRGLQRALRGKKSKVFFSLHAFTLSTTPLSQFPRRNVAA
jgi:hypothetical protein